MWKRVVNGVYPEGGFNANSSIDGPPLYVARSLHEGYIVVGSATHGQTTASFLHKGQILESANFWILCGTDFAWKLANSLSGDLIPQSAFAAGSNAYCDPLFVGRVPVNGRTWCGKIDLQARHLEVAAYNISRTFLSFEVLVKNGADSTYPLRVAPIRDVSIGRRSTE